MKMILRVIVQMDFEVLLQQARIAYYKDFEMKKLTTFKIGGKAKYLIYPKNEEELKKIVFFSKECDVDVCILGNCSNVLISDMGFDGAIILTVLMNGFSLEHTKVWCQAGCMLSNIAKICCEEKLTGLEFAVGIPGTVGGAVYMNAGAYGMEIKDVFYQAEVLDENLQVRILTKDDMNFSYRYSCLHDNNYIVLKAFFLLRTCQDNVSPIENARMLNEKRREKQPLNFPSAGSIFKRPEGHYAGKLIEDAGFKGYKIGDAAVSEKHAGFIINYGNAKAEDVVKLIIEIQKRVYEKFGILLEPEIKFVGHFDMQPLKNIER